MAAAGAVGSGSVADHAGACSSLQGVSEPSLPRPDAADAALADALSEPLPGELGPAELLTLPELAERSELSLPLLEAVVREGLLAPRAGDPDRFALADAEVVRAGLRLVESGLPLAELLDLARRTDEALRAIAADAVDRFARFVRDPAHGTARDEDEAAARVVTAFRDMLPATERLVGQHFRQLLVAEARQRLGDGTED